MINWILRQLLSVLWRGLPVVFFFVFAGLGFAIRTSFVGLIAAFIGVPEAAERMAYEWTSRALRVGFPTLWERQLRFFLIILAYATIYTGWSIASFTAFIAIDLVFLR